MSVRTTYICDLCGKESRENDNHTVTIEARHGSYRRWLAVCDECVPISEKDLGERVLRAVRNWFKGGVK